MKQVLSDQDVADLVEMVPDDFDMPIYFAFVRAVESAVLAKVEPVFRDAAGRMDRARDILTDGKPRPECNWGMLDASGIRALLGEES